MTRWSLRGAPDGGSLNAVRIRDWKVHFAVGDAWFGGTVAFPQNFPLVTNLRMDPYEAVIGDTKKMAMYFRLGRRQAVDLPADASIRRELPEILPGIPAATGLGKFKHWRGSGPDEEHRTYGKIVRFAFCFRLAVGMIAWAR